jgi:FkbH-like protein
MDDYLGSLKTVVEMDICRAESVARVAQLTQKTNQFNLTTRRYNEPQIEEIIESDNQEALSCTVMDRFGDYGLVGVCLLKYRDDVAEIDTLLLSCRVLGRGVEAAFLSAIASWVLKAGKKELIGIRIPTPKNIVTENYLPQAALLEQRVQEDGAELFRYDLGEWELAPPAHIDLKWR